MSMKMQHTYHQPEGTRTAIPMMEVTLEVSDFHSEHHPGLWSVVRRLVKGRVEEDLTIEGFNNIHDDHLKSSTEKARWVAENAACLYAAEILTQWGSGYRSDDGFDYLSAAIDNVSFLTNIDLPVEDFEAWWNAEPFVDVEPHHEFPRDVFGATDGEIRFNMFPKRSDYAEWEATSGEVEGS